MRAIEVLESLKKYADRYHLGAAESVKRNAHMNAYRGPPLSQDAINALLVDYLNFIGALHGIDYALYTVDLKPPDKQA